MSGSPPPEPVNSADILVIGGGIAGLSAAAALSSHARVMVVEAEEHIGFHSSGRSATMVHYALGDRLIRELTLASRPFFDEPPGEFTDVALGQPMTVLIHARGDELDALSVLESDLHSFAVLDRLDTAATHELCPLLKPDAVAGLADRKGMRLDPHALLQGNLRQLRRRGGQLKTGFRVRSITRRSGAWLVESDTGDSCEAPILVNAAGAWADEIARLAGVRELGLRPLRRTIITFDAPADVRLDRLPFAKTIGDELYFAPESGRLFASPMDEVPSAPCDAQPAEDGIALAAYRMEERTTVKVERIHSRWAGLRTFAPDRHPVAGFAANTEGFFWLAGQGGFGLQTSPAMASIAQSLIIGTPWPLANVSEDSLSPGRLLRQPA
jgi:D-arginine dehydrogenase